MRVLHMLVDQVGFCKLRADNSRRRSRSTGNRRRRHSDQHRHRQSHSKGGTLGAYTPTISGASPIGGCCQGQPVILLHFRVRVSLG